MGINNQRDLVSDDDVAWHDSDKLAGLFCPLRDKNRREGIMSFSNDVRNELVGNG